MSLLGPTGVVLAIIVICTQVLVVYNFRNKVASKIAEEEIDLAEEIEIGKSTTNLPPHEKDHIHLSQQVLNFFCMKTRSDMAVFHKHESTLGKTQ